MHIIHQRGSDIARREYICHAFHSHEFIDEHTPEAIVFGRDRLSQRVRLQAGTPDYRCRSDALTRRQLHSGSINTSDGYSSARLNTQILESFFDNLTSFVAHVRTYSRITVGKNHSEWPGCARIRYNRL